MIFFLGIVVSLLVQYLKTKYPMGGWKTMGILVVVSLIGSGLYTYLVTAGLWESVSQVLITAGAFYAFVIQRFEA